MDDVPSVSVSVPVSAVVRLAAVEEGVLGERNLNSADSLFLTVGSDPMSTSVRFYQSHSESSVRAERSF